MINFNRDDNHECVSPIAMMVVRTMKVNRDDDCKLPIQPQRKSRQTCSNARENEVQRLKQGDSHGRIKRLTRWISMMFVRVDICDIPWR
jgi:hypothetical protein